MQRSKKAAQTHRGDPYECLPIQRALAGRSYAARNALAVEPTEFSAALIV
jgi:hypothetical protein